MDVNSRSYPRNILLPPLERSPDIKVVPATAGQAGLWVLYQTQKPDFFYHEQTRIEISGDLDASRLAQCLTILVERYETLRTVFRQSESGDLVQVVQEAFPVQIETLTVQNSDADGRSVHDLVSEIALERGRFRYNLEELPLFRVCLLKLPNNSHLLLFSYHHIILDAWSFKILVQDWQALEFALSKGMRPQLPALDTRFADYALWERNFLRSKAGSDSIAYWDKKLASIPPLLNLPYCRSLSRTKSNIGSRKVLKLSKALSRSIKKLSADQGVSVGHVLHATLSMLLMCYTRQNDICVGNLRHNRLFPELLSVMGYFVNTTLIRINFSKSDTFADLLKQTKTLIKEASYDFPLPHSNILELARKHGYPSDKPLCQVAIDYSGLPFEEIRLADELVVTDSRVSTTGDVKFELLFSFIERKECLEGYVDYDIGLFDEVSVEQMAGHYVNLLKAVSKNADGSLSKINFLSRSDRKKMLYEWNEIEAQNNSNEIIHRMFESRALEMPESTAISFDDKQVSYRELNESSNRLAHYLISYGIKPEARVALFLNRSEEMLIAILGVQKSGGVYVPIDPEFPAERIEYILRDSGAEIVLTQHELKDFLSHSCKQIDTLCLDTNWGEIASFRNDNPVVRLDIMNLAYVIYTSGSTGKPKGVMCIHEGLTNCILWMQKKYRLTSKDKVLQKTPYSFDVSILELLWPIAVGAQLHIAPPGAHKDISYLEKVIQVNEITMLHFVPSMLEAFLANIKSENFPALRNVICIGEALSTAVQNQFLARFKNTKLHNLYGPTEASIIVTYWQCRRDEDCAAVPIGRPMGEVQVYILDQELRPVPIGVPGDLYIGGIALARGYENKATRTASEFIPNPFARQRGSRMYRTGDLARWLHCGDIEYLGRVDHQVKIRGYRIELEEIENRLLEYEPILDCVAVASGEGLTNTYLVAYIVVSESELAPMNADRCSVSHEEFLLKLNKYLSDLLPHYMVPAKIVLLKELPLTPNGKVDRKALPSVEVGISKLNSYIAPRTDTEKSLSDIWAEVLDIPTNQVSINDDFFSLGGHSLMAMRVVRKVRDVLKAQLGIQDILSSGSIEKLASTIENIARDDKLAASLIGRSYKKPLEREEAEI